MNTTPKVLVPTLGTPQTKTELMSPKARDRRVFLSVGAAALGSISTLGLLTGCGGGGAYSSVASVDALILAAGPLGVLQRSWHEPYRMTLNGKNYGDGTPKLLNGPQSAAQAPDGTMWIADTGNARLLHLDAQLRLLGVLTSIAAVRLRRPTGVAIATDGRLAVADPVVGNIAVSDSTGAGTWLGKPVESQVASGWRPHWASETDNELLDNPRIVGFSGDGTLHALDTAARRIVRFDSNLLALPAINISGAASGMAIAGDGSIFVVIPSGNDVLRIAYDGAVAYKLRISRASPKDGRSATRLTWSADGVMGGGNLMVSLFL